MNSKPVPVVLLLAIALILTVAWRPLTANLQSAISRTPASPSPTPTNVPTPTPTLEPEELATEPTPTPELAMPAPSPEMPQQKCLDGSQLTVTDRDCNQTNYRCESGSVGAYLN